MMEQLRCLFHPRPIQKYSDDAIANALIATAGHDSEWWFSHEHINYAWRRLTAR